MSARFIPLFLALVAAGPSLLATPYHFSFSSLTETSSAVHFDGNSNSFSFQPDGVGARDFSVSGSDFGDLDGFRGSIAGTFGIGPITVTGLRQRASVSGSGQFTIYDSLGQGITANLAWVDIFTRESLGGINSGGLNTLGTVNLVNFSGYTGFDSRLSSFAGNSGNIVLTIALSEFNLVELTADGTTHDNAYSGSAIVASTAVPDSPLGWSPAVVLAGVLVAARFRRSVIAV